MKVLNQFLACLVTALMLIGVFEGGLRLIGFSPRPTMNRFDPELGWSKSPSASMRRRTGEFDVLLETNSRGLRESEGVGYQKPEGVERVLLVGDSFTLGYTVAGAETISALLEERLVAQGYGVEVINAGTEGYSTDQEVLWLAGEGLRYDPDIVILQMYENDIFWNGQDHYLRYPKPRFAADSLGIPVRAEPLADPGEQAWLVRHTALGNLVQKTFASSSGPVLPGPRPLPAEWGARLSDQAPGWPETEAALRAFETVTQDFGARALVLVIPDKAQIDGRAREVMAGVMGDPAYDPERPFVGMVNLARRQGLPVVDPRGSLRSALVDGPLYFERDWHTNARGNRILADDLAQALATPDFLGEPMRTATPWHREAGASVDRGPGHTGLLLGLALVWLVLGTMFWRTFPEQGLLGSFAPVAGLIGLVVGIFYGFDWIRGLLPFWMQGYVPLVFVSAVLGAALFYLRKRLGVMAELFGTFVRRGQWYALPVLAGLLSVGGLLVVAASSPWLAPFIYTLF